jgi:hypothetical protein
MIRIGHNQTYTVTLPVVHVHARMDARMRVCVSHARAFMMIDVAVTVS